MTSLVIGTVSACLAQHKWKHHHNWSHLPGIVVQYRGWQSEMSKKMKRIGISGRSQFGRCLWRNVPDLSVSDFHSLPNVHSFFLQRFPRKEVSFDNCNFFWWRGRNYRREFVGRKIDFDNFILLSWIYRIFCDCNKWIDTYMSEFFFLIPKFEFDWLLLVLSEMNCFINIALTKRQNQSARFLTIDVNLDGRI